jgi:hypothetical protein
MWPRSPDIVGGAKASVIAEDTERHPPTGTEVTKGRTIPRRIPPARLGGGRKWIARIAEGVAADADTHVRASAALALLQSARRVTVPCLLAFFAISWRADPIVLLGGCVAPRQN